MSNQPHRISIVIPVFRGESTLPTLISEIANLRHRMTPDGHEYLIEEVILVDDCGPDNSADVIRAQAARFDWVKPVWLSRSYGQHAATLAGMAGSSGEWILTMDDDLRHDPRHVTTLLDQAMTDHADLVYGTLPVGSGNEPKKSAKRSTRIAGSMLGMDPDAAIYHSFRLLSGEIGRAVAAYAGPGVYLDVALSWVARRAVYCPVTEGSKAVRNADTEAWRHRGHFWRMILSSGTRPLKSLARWGVISMVLAVWTALAGIGVALATDWPVPSWVGSLAVALLAVGAIMMVLGIIAEYVGQAVSTAMGRPLYLVVKDPMSSPQHRPLARRRMAEIGLPQDES